MMRDDKTGTVPGAPYRSLKKLCSLVRQALQKYDMIDEGDRILVGVSGGKDSMGLLTAMAALQKYYPKKFDVAAVTVDLGYEGFDTEGIQNFCDSLGVGYHVIKTEISRMAAEGGCSLCAHLRRGALVDFAAQNGYNSIALGHTMDDMTETMMLSLIHEGRFSTFLPVTDYEDKGIKIIRPYMLVTNSVSIGFSRKMNIPVVKNPCPYDHSTERSYVRELLKDIEKHAPGARERMMTAIMNGNIF